MVAEGAEGSFACGTDTTVWKAVGSWFEMEVAEYDLDMLEDLRSDTDQPVEAVMLARGNEVD